MICEQNITRLLLELGSVFVFIGRQKEISIVGSGWLFEVVFYTGDESEYVT